MLRGLTTGHHWYYAIASKKLWGTGIPSHNPAVKVVELWAKVPDGYGSGGDSDESSDSDDSVVDSLLLHASDEDGGEPPKHPCPDDPASARALARKRVRVIGVLLSRAG